MVEHQIDMDHGKDDEEPHHQMMPLADGEVSSHQWDDPAEHMGEPGMAHRRVHPESCDRLKEEDQKADEVCKPGEAVVSDGFKRPAACLEYVDPENFLHFRDLFFAVEDEILPPGELVSDEPPVDAGKKIEEEDLGDFAKSKVLEAWRNHEIVSDSDSPEGDFFISIQHLIEAFIDEVAYVRKKVGNGWELIEVDEHDKNN